MTSKQVVDNLLQGKPAERIAFHDHGPWKETLKKWVKEGYPTVKSDTGVETPVSFVDHFGYDMSGVGGWFDWMPLRGFREVLEETNNSITIRNGAGAVMRNWKTYASTPEWVSFRVASRDIWDKEYRPHLLEIDRQRLNIAGVKQNLEAAREKGRWAFFGNQFLWENMRNMLGNVCMLESMLLEPGWIHDFNRVYTDFYKNHFRILIEEAGRPDGIWLYEDLGYKNALACSPKTLQELIFPYYKELVQFFHSYDLPVVLHSDGHIDEAIPLIIDAGFCAINPIDTKAGCDLFKYAEQYGDKLAFIGGFNESILESADRQLIKREVVRIVEGMKSLGVGYLFGVDHSISPNVTYASFKYALEIYREHMYYNLS